MRSRKRRYDPLKLLATIVVLVRLVIDMLSMIDL